MVGGEWLWAAGSAVLLLGMAATAVAAPAVVNPANPGEELVVSTYNLWNIMFNWDVRKLRIAQLIREEWPDVIAFQEVRGSARTRHSQVDDLQSILPHYKHGHFEVASVVKPPPAAYGRGWEQEGLGLLSRHPILYTEGHHLSHHQGPDTNRRLLLRVVIDIPKLGSVNIIVVHFSYDRVQQCSNAAELLKFIEDKKLQNVIVLGDFNTYADYESPILIVTGAATDLNNRCPPQYRRRHLLGSPDSSLVDSWRSVHPDKAGLTFSNMPAPGMESRPDRILVCERFRVLSATTHGNGSVYKQRFFMHIWWNRLENLLQASRDVQQGLRGRPCPYDCGPHASCRCGVCVAGGDDHACVLPDCPECAPGMLLLATGALVALVPLTAQLLYAMLQVLYTMNRHVPDEAVALAALNCCLCNPRLYAAPSGTRRCRNSRLARVWPFLRLPPVFLVVVSVLLAFLWLETVLFFFRDSLRDISAILPEELYPSDHLLLVVHVRKPVIGDS